jgi:hypothetical protein
LPLDGDPCEPREPTTRELALERALVRARVETALLQASCNAQVRRAMNRVGELHYYWLCTMASCEKKWNARHLELTAELRTRVQELEAQAKEKST